MSYQPQRNSWKDPVIPTGLQQPAPAYLPIQRQSLPANRKVYAPGFPPAQHQHVFDDRNAYAPGYPPAQRQSVFIDRSVYAPGYPPTQRPPAPVNRTGYEAGRVWELPDEPHSNVGNSGQRTQGRSQIPNRPPTPYLPRPGQNTGHEETHQLPAQERRRVPHRPPTPGAPRQVLNTRRAENHQQSAQERTTIPTVNGTCVLCEERVALIRGKIVNECNHSSTMCQDCLAQHIAAQLIPKSWNGLSCPMCPAKMTFDAVRDYGSKASVER